MMQKDNIIDELMKNKGRLSYNQFNPSKRMKFDIKFYKLCESKSSYNFKIIYNKHGNDKINSSDNAFESVVKELLQSILYKKYILYLDNWYSLPKLFKTLINNKINVVATVCSNRNNMPNDFCKIKLKKDECRIRNCNGILALKWKDITKRDVYILF